jgi:hypothetical protein
VGGGVWLGIAVTIGVGDNVGRKVAGGVGVGAIEMEVAEGLRVDVWVAVTVGLAVAVRTRVGLGLSVDAGVDDGSSEAGRSERVSTLAQPIKSSPQMASVTSRSANRQDLSSNGMGATGSPTETGSSPSGRVFHGFLPADLPAAL